MAEFVVTEDELIEEIKFPPKDNNNNEKDEVITEKAVSEPENENLENQKIFELKRIIKYELLEENYL